MEEIFLKERETFGSRLGFILVSAGCAVGLGNVWKFPYMTGKYGGAAFILIYLVFLVLLGLPILGEVIGTGLIGSVLSYPVMTYLWGRTGLTWMFYVPSFLMGTIIGGSIAYVLLKSMSRSGILENIQRKLGVQKFVETNE